MTVRRLAVHHPTGSVAGLGLEGALHVGRGVAPAGFLALTGGSASWRREGSARRLGLDAAARASLDGDAVRLQVHATLIEGFEGLPLREGPLLDLEATARVEPASRCAVVRLERAALLGAAARSTAALSLRDGEALPVVEAAEVSADLAALL
ncbi:MAG: hypothetical protein INH37_09970, partial [Myxococcaceae bacterium]|nr:hypothetical protein [Myxococcaceae bacterium]